MDIVNMRVNTRGLTYADLKVGTTYVTGPNNDQVFLCVGVAGQHYDTRFTQRNKRLVRLRDSTVYSGDDFIDTQEFAPVQAKVVIE